MAEARPDPRAGRGPRSTVESPVEAEPKHLTTKIMETVSSTLQPMQPIKNFSQHICTWAQYSEDPSRKIETHHHASRINEDLTQCVVYDSGDKDAKIIGIEYIISDKLFATLPEEEKALWHSHFYEIHRALWVLPGMGAKASQPELKKMAPTYGKFWLFWQADKGDALPLGLPSLMMSPQDSPLGTISAEEIARRDAKWNTNTPHASVKRAEYIEPSKSGLDPAADQWKTTNSGWALELKKVPYPEAYGKNGMNVHH